MFECKRCEKVYKDFGSLYRHSVKQHHERCTRSGEWFPISEDCLQEYLERVRRSQENSRQRRARQLRENQELDDKLFDCRQSNDTVRILSMRQSSERAADKSFRSRPSCCDQPSDVSTPAVIGIEHGVRRKRVRSPLSSHEYSACGFSSEGASVRNNAESASRRRKSAPCINASAPQENVSAPRQSTSAPSVSASAPRQIAAIPCATTSAPQASALVVDSAATINSGDELLTVLEAIPDSWGSVTSTFVPWSEASASAVQSVERDEFQTVVGSLEPLPLLQLLDSVDVDVSSLLNFDESVIVSTAEIQTDSVFTVDGDSQTPNRNSCLDFCANKYTQTVRHRHLVDAESQSESFLGEYEGRMRIPAGVTRERLIAAVIDNPSYNTRFIARQLATNSSLRLVGEQALGLLELLTDVVAATEDFIRGRLQEVANNALLLNPSGETVLEHCARYLNRAADRSDE
jgi:hypothetical protein